MYDPLRLPSFTEVDAVDRYVRAMVDELDDCAIRTRVYKRKGENMLVLPGSLVLECRVGWFKGSAAKIPATNLSRVFYGNRESLYLAKQLAEAMGHWGELYGSHHRGANAVADDGEDLLLKAEGAWGLRLEPFALNGPDALDYCKRLDNLGRDVGRVLTGYLMAKDQARSRPSTLDTLTPRVRY